MKASVIDPATGITHEIECHTTGVDDDGNVVYVVYVVSIPFRLDMTPGVSLIEVDVMPAHSVLEVSFPSDVAIQARLVRSRRWLRWSRWLLWFAIAVNVLISIDLWSWWRLINLVAAAGCVVTLWRSGRILANTSWCDSAACEVTP